jgi:hypothetical protein
MLLRMLKEPMCEFLLEFERVGAAIASQISIPAFQCNTEALL